MSYSSSAVVRFNLTTSFDKATIQSMIMSAAYQNGGTGTGHGLNLIYSNVLTQSAGYRGGDAVVIVITNSPAQETATYLAQAAANVQSVATVFSIGVGSDVSLNELTVISGSSSRVISINYSDLSNSSISQLVATVDCTQQDLATFATTTLPTTTIPTTTTTSTSTLSSTTTTSTTSPTTTTTSTRYVGSWLSE